VRVSTTQSSRPGRTKWRECLRFKSQTVLCNTPHCARTHTTTTFTRMAGSEWIWANGTDELERLCCLMAGLAVLTTKGGEDPIRKQDAFCGRLQLPFFETAPPAPEAMRITLIPHFKRWVLFRLDSKGRPKILCSLRGFEGFCDVALQLVASLR